LGTHEGYPYSIMLVVVAVRKIVQKYSYLAGVNRIASSLTLGYPRGVPLQVDCMADILDVRISKCLMIQYCL
jgi:hypothetical protein